jgi:hypothetical protein
MVAWIRTFGLSDFKCNMGDKVTVQAQHGTQHRGKRPKLGERNVEGDGTAFFAKLYQGEEIKTDGQGMQHA